MPLHIVISKNKIKSHDYDSTDPNQLDRDTFNIIKDIMDPSNSIKYRREYSKLYNKKYRENKKEKDSEGLSVLVNKLDIKEGVSFDNYEIIESNSTSEIIRKMWHASKNKITIH